MKLKLFRKPASQTPRRRVQKEAEQSPPRTFSYRARRSDEETNTGRQLGRKFLKPAGNRLGNYWLQRFGLAILLVATAVALVNALTLSSQAKVMTLATSSSRPFLRPAADYQAAADQLLHSSVWDHNKITFDAAKFERQMLKQFPELASASVTVPLLAHRPVVYVQPAQPALVLNASNGSFVIDASGKAVVSANSSTARNLPTLPPLNDQSGLSAKLHEQALPKADVSFIQTVLAELAAKQFSVSDMALPASSSELDVHIKGQPYLVKFNLQSRDPRGQAGTFLAAIASLHRQNVTPAKYVDVRVPGRAYYQ
jgi:cell division septal protein FtsQ